MAMGIVNVPSSGAGAADELLMTGYEKPASASPVEATDTVVEAIGKIEAGLDGSAGGGSCGVRLADVTNASASGANGKAFISWTDPDDVSYEDASLARWAGTKLVRSTTGVPETVEEGTVVADSKIRNQYAANPLGDSNLVNGTIYYYRLFPYTDAGSYTPGASLSAIPNAGPATMSVSPDTVSLDYTRLTTTVTVNTNSNGPISIVSSDADEEVITATLSGNTITITAVDDGTATITVSQGDGNGYTAPPDAVISVSVMMASSNLGDNTPAQIQNAIQAGKAASLWNVGDKIGIPISGKVGGLTLSDTCYATIIGIDHNKDRESGGAYNVHFIFGKTVDNKDICFVDSGYGSGQSGANYFHHHTSNTNTNGWSGSDLRTMCSTFLGCMPAEWQAVIGSSTKYSDNHGGGSDTASYVTATQDKVFLLAEWEVQGARTYANSAEKNYQQQYDYYKNGNSKIRYKHNSTSTAAYWWLRSVSAADATLFCGVYTGGSANYYGASGSYGFAPGFAIF